MHVLASWALAVVMFGALGVFLGVLLGCIIINARAEASRLGDLGPNPYRAKPKGGVVGRVAAIAFTVIAVVVTFGGVVILTLGWDHAWGVLTFGR
jgi:hypothetical protein